MNVLTYGIDGKTVRANDAVTYDRNGKGSVIIHFTDGTKLEIAVDLKQCADGGMYPAVQFRLVGNGGSVMEFIETHTVFT